MPACESARRDARRGSVKPATQPGGARQAGPDHAKHDATSRTATRPPTILSADYDCYRDSGGCRVMEGA
jgi:hypothetical protein